MAITHYQILAAADDDQLASLVTTAIASGWDALIGGYSISGNYHYQAMVKGSPTLTNSQETQTLTTEAGAGITGGTGTVYETSVRKVGGIYHTTIMIDLTGLASSTTDLDIIGVGSSVAHIGRITAAQNGTILAVRMTCLELPAGGADDIDLYSATEGTGVFDGGVAALTETAVITAGGAWANGTVKGATTVPAANEYLYLVGGEAGTAATYTAGKFVIELFGYDA